MTRVVSIPYTFVMLNWAAVLGLIHFMRGAADLWTSSDSGR
jgi:hypothetical protein